ncbi:DUF6236 family protein [Streptomyces sp. NPDC004838]
MGVLLYYPAVNPPTEVVHQALLYWDGLASVVPRDPRVYEAVVGEELKRLEERELYRPLAFAEGSLAVLDEYGRTISPSGQSSTVLVEQLRRIAQRPNPPRPGDPPEAVLLFSKTTWWLERMLVDLGLAVRHRARNLGLMTLGVSQEVQTLIVGVLARELAVNPDIVLFPYTDSESAYRDSLRSATPTGFLGWEMELGRLLPVPAPNTPTTEVLAFRDKYTDERVRLMRALHRLFGELRRDYEHPADAFAQLRVELSQALEDYRAASRSSRMAWAHRSITVSVALAASAGGALLLPDAGWLLGTIGGYALNVATREIRPLRKAPQNHDFSYLHRVHTALS